LYGHVFRKNIINSSSTPTTTLIFVQTQDGTLYKGNVRTVSPFVSAESKNFEVSVSIQDKTHALRPGMFVSAVFVLKQWKQVHSLPFAALSGGDTLWYVEDDKARKMEYTPSEFSDTAFLIPPEFENRIFITEGQYFVFENSPVRIINKDSIQ